MSVLMSMLNDILFLVLHAFHKLLVHVFDLLMNRKENLFLNGRLWDYYLQYQTILRKSAG